MEKGKNLQVGQEDQRVQPLHLSQGDPEERVKD